MRRKDHSLGMRNHAMGKDRDMVRGRIIALVGNMDHGLKEWIMGRKDPSMDGGGAGCRGKFVKKGMFLYSATSSPSDRSKRFTLFALPGRPVHSDTNSASPGSILAMQQLRATTKSLTFLPPSIARYSMSHLYS